MNILMIFYRYQSTLYASKSRVGITYDIKSYSNIDCVPTF